jgi:hypothetical protein
MLRALPPELSPKIRALLSEDGAVYSKEDVDARRFLVDDDPRMADAVRQAKLSVAFADLQESHARSFYLASGVQLLSEARKWVRVAVGEHKESPPWFREASELEHLHRPLFAEAVCAIAAATDSSQRTSSAQLLQRLRKIRSIRFVTSIKNTYNLIGSEISVAAYFAVDDRAIMLMPLRSHSELFGRVAHAVAQMLTTATTTRYGLSDSIYRLLTCETSHEIVQYLEQRGLSIGRPKVEDQAGIDVSFDEAGETKDVDESLDDELLRAVVRHAQDVPVDPSVASVEVPQPSETEEHAPLPPLERVQLRDLSDAELPARRKGSRRGAGGGRGPRTPAEQEQDQQVGDRAEELVYLQEIERVTALGHPPSRVVWTSKTNRTANHDILSIADDGGDLWVEVKGTRGRHGRFFWEGAEFNLAVQKRERYVLCRVYEADTVAPSVRRIVDPIGKLDDGQMRLDIATLEAVVPPLSGN